MPSIAKILSTFTVPFILKLGMDIEIPSSQPLAGQVVGCLETGSWSYSTTHCISNTLATLALIGSMVGAIDTDSLIRTSYYPGKSQYQDEKYLRTLVDLYGHNGTHILTEMVHNSSYSGSEGYTGFHTFQVKTGHTGEEHIHVVSHFIDEEGKNGILYHLNTRYGHKPIPVVSQGGTYYKGQIVSGLATTISKDEAPQFSLLNFDTFADQVETDIDMFKPSSALTIEIGRPEDISPIVELKLATFNNAAVPLGKRKKPQPAKSVTTDKGL